MRRNVKLPLIACLLVTAVGASAAAAAPRGTGCNNTTTGTLAKCVIGSASASGDYAAAAANGNALRPSSIAVVVYSKPAQQVQVTWSMTCLRGGGAGSKSGTFSTTTYGSVNPTPTGIRAHWSLKKLTIPMRTASSCGVAAEAQIAQSGWIRVQIVAVRR